MKTFNVAEDKEEVQDPKFAAIDAQRYNRENRSRISEDQLETLREIEAWVGGLGMPGTPYTTARMQYVTVKMGPIDKSIDARSRLKVHPGYTEMQKLENPNPPIPITHFKKCEVRKKGVTLLARLYY
jgi:hypothetical protein